MGSLALDDRESDEVLVRIERSGQVSVIDDDLSLSNGLAWSPAGDRFYNIDTLSRTVWSRAYDPETGTCGPREVLLRLVNGNPDGLCVDSDGNLWIAIWGAREVRCYSPTGLQLATLEADAPNVSSVAFVGQELDILLITTASEQLSPSELAQYPNSGRLFSCRVGVHGLPVPYWSGLGGPVTVDRPD